MYTCPIKSYSLGATYIKQTRCYVCDKMAGGPTKSRDNIDYCRLDTRFLFVRFLSHFGIPAIRAKSVPLFETHRVKCQKRDSPDNVLHAALISNPTGSNVMRDTPDNATHTAPISSLASPANLFWGINVFSCLSICKCRTTYYRISKK